MRVSQLVKVRALAVALGMLLVPSLVVLHAPPARAAVDVPVPVRFPGSAVGAGVSADTLNRVHAANPGKLVIPGGGTAGPGAPKVGVKPGGISGAAAVIGTFAVSHEVGKGIVKLLGLPTSGSTLCDFATVALGSGCALVASPEYVANSDLPASVPGWEFPAALMDQQQRSFLSLVGNELDALNAEMTLDQLFLHLPGSLSTSFSGQNNTTGGVYTSPNINSDLYLYVRNASGSLTIQLETYKINCYAHIDAPVACGVSPPLTRSFQRDSAWVESRLSGGYRLVYATVNGAGPTPPRWYPQGSPDRPNSDPNPERRWRTDWLCSTGGPGSSTSSAFRESDSEWPAMPAAQCSGSAVPTKVTWWQVTPGQEDVLLNTWELPPNESDFIENNPDCVGGGCQLLLERIDQVTGKRYSCFANPSLCDGWFENPQKEDTFACSYGGQSVRLAECNMYRVTFGIGTIGVLSDPDPENPDPQPPVSPEPPGDPDDSPKDDACPPPFSWLSAVNPWWYWKATTCALNDAFVPKSVANNVARINNAWKMSAPGVVVPLIGITAAGFAVDGSCGVIYNAPISAFGGRTMTLDTCQSPWPEFWVVKQAFGLAFIIGSGVVLLRMISRTFRVDP